MNHARVLVEVPHGCVHRATVGAKWQAIVLRNPRLPPVKCSSQWLLNIGAYGPRSIAIMSSSY
jgi:hypothetical protein